MIKFYREKVTGCSQNRPQRKMNSLERYALENEKE